MKGDLVVSRLAVLTRCPFSGHRQRGAFALCRLSPYWVGFLFSLYTVGVSLPLYTGRIATLFVIVSITSFSYLGGAVGDSGRAEVLV